MTDSPFLAIPQFCIIAHFDHGNRRWPMRLFAGNRTVAARGLCRPSSSTTWNWRDGDHDQAPAGAQMEFKAAVWRKLTSSNLIDPPGHVDFLL